MREVPVIPASRQALVIFGLFALLYLLVLVRKAIRRELDLYDLFMLSTVVAVPGLFLYLPVIATEIAAAVGVAFPFVVMFSALFAVVFVFAHRLTVRIGRLEHDNRMLVQEIGLLRESQERRSGKQL